MKALICRFVGHRWAPWWRMNPPAIGAQCQRCFVVKPVNGDGNG